MNYKAVALSNRQKRFSGLSELSLLSSGQFSQLYQEAVTSMTQGRIYQRPGSEGQPECHPRRDAQFNFIPLGARLHVGSR